MRRWLTEHGYNLMHEWHDKRQETCYWRRSKPWRDVFLVRTVARRKLLRNLIAASGLFRVVKSKRGRQRIWLALGVCLERLVAILRDERIVVRQPQSAHWTTPFRDD